MEERFLGNTEKKTREPFWVIGGRNFSKKKSFVVFGFVIAQLPTISLQLWSTLDDNSFDRNVAF